jgi:hypothetical protein
MLTKQGLEFMLRITDFFGGRWEDPGWGQQPINQVLVMLSAHTMAEGIEDDKARREVQGPLEKAIAGTAQRIVRQG